MTKPYYTEIVFVLDRSGSMASIKDDMIGGFDAFIKEQRKILGECRVTLVRFDDVYEVAYAGIPLAEVRQLVLDPRGSTALLDAIGTAIMTTGARLRGIPENHRPAKVVFVVITDGQENASHEYRADKIASMIKHQRERYSWEFIFLGCGEDSISVASALNINHAAVMVAGGAGAAAAFTSSSASVGAYRAGGQSAVMDFNQGTYNAHVQPQPNVATATGIVITTTDQTGGTNLGISNTGQDHNTVLPTGERK